MTPLVLTQQLIRCQSVTPFDDGALDIIDQLLQKAGFTNVRLPFSENQTPVIDNLYARFGTQEPCLLFAGHTDVVPPGDASLWKHDPFSATVDGELLYGRGSADMKGGVACMVMAALHFVRKHPDFKGSIAFLISGDEEGPAINGTVKVLDWMQQNNQSFDHCILGEPSNPHTLGQMIKIGRRGSLTGHLTVYGKQGHVAYPDLADNPIPKLLTLMQALSAKSLDDGNALFDPSNLEFTNLEVGNTASNVIPAKATATFNIRFNDFWTSETLAKDIASRIATSASNIQYELNFLPTNAEAFITQPNTFTELVKNVIQQETGLTADYSTTGGTSDARFIKNFGPVIEFGLTNATIHQIDEHVKVDDLDKLTRIYEKILKHYFRGCRR